MADITNKISSDGFSTRNTKISKFFLEEKYYFFGSFS